MMLHKNTDTANTQFQFNYYSFSLAFFIFSFCFFLSVASFFVCLFASYSYKFMWNCCYSYFSLLLLLLLLMIVIIPFRLFFNLFSQQIKWNKSALKLFFIRLFNFPQTKCEHKYIKQIETSGVSFMLVAAAAAAVNVVKFIDFSCSVNSFLIW